MPPAGFLCTVYYDGACPLCRREIALYRRAEGAQRIAWIDASTCEAAQLGADLARDAALARLHVRRSDGALVSGAAAFAAIWGRLPAYAWLARLGSSRPALALMEAAYSAFLSSRRLWRGAPASASALPRKGLADLRADHAAAAGADAEPAVRSSRLTKHAPGPLPPAR
jgi:ubiquinone biosynthesis monooxygenase Coq7